MIVDRIIAHTLVILKNLSLSTSQYYNLLMVFYFIQCENVSFQ
jgi:hypothetical protein